MKILITKIIYFSIVIAAISGLINSATALTVGFIFTLIFKNPFKTYSHKAIHYFLKISVIGLGFGMFLKETIQTGKDGLSLTFFSIVLTVSLGLILAKFLRMDLKLGHLITSGTSICGGSAIAAIAPVIKANGKIISIALGVVFLLNSIALFLFPALGHWLGLSQSQFGLWCAIAIHDTSSVVGAALDYGDQALKIATTVKLSRTLWIIPLSVLSMFIFKTKGEKIKIPYFIILFICAILINSYHILPSFATTNIVLYSKRLLVLTLFIVGTTISIKDLKTTGSKPIILAFALWVFISVFSLVYILHMS
ncbi:MULTISPECIES: YeiH family protein [unclassified Cellulophaga]|uniref:YeiH family protein n=1 Tax=unclassified Cellulophaga TaxID=2634405 RepID=UPI0026E3ECA7|nr:MULTISPECIES: putative sulfate exporter family transporter [unclassified Cellulophaga]MDO6489833.1 putative sulfate exporter family transporter [Cellulophaga sp. 2_MG-2023]MDO6494973.1 putative sulfate exporter family transporter [Cellulophaga sp. 3_MG-2023]